MIRNILNAERQSFIQLRNLQNVKINFCINYQQKVINIYPKYISPFSTNSYAKRFASSDAGITSNVTHKVQFVNASYSNDGDSINDSANITPSGAITSDNVSSTGTVENLLSSTSESVTGISFIPPPPIPVEALNIPLNALGEETFASIGLGGWYPTSIARSALEYIHVTFDMPWWATIMCATVVLRMVVSPLVIKSQRYNAETSHLLPKLAEMQEDAQEATISGNKFEAAKRNYNLQKFIKVNNLSPMNRLKLPLVQAPIFLTMFWSLRSCTNLPVESFTTGGALWFTDLTVMDPYYILPVITSATLLATLKLGADGVDMSSNSNVMKYIMTAIPVVMFPFIMHFPAAMLCYWLSTNVFSLAQVSVLKIPHVKNYFGIIKKEVEKKKDSKTNPKGFVSTFKEAVTNVKNSYSRLNARDIGGSLRRKDAIAFKKAGMQPMLRTYKTSPVKRKQISK